MREEVVHHLARRPKALLVGRVDSVGHALRGGIHNEHGERGGGGDGVHVGKGLGGLKVQGDRLRLLSLGGEEGATEGGEGRRE